MSSPGICYNLRYLGCTSISKFNAGLAVLQKPLHDLYVNHLTPKGPKPPVICRMAMTDRGILLTTNGHDAFYSMRDILLWEAVHWVCVQTKDKKIMSAFEPIDPDHHRSQEGLFSKLDSQYKYLARLQHEAVLACVLRKSGSKQIDVHGFLCGSEAQVMEVISSLWHIDKQFEAQEARGVRVVNNQEQIRSSVRSPSAGGVPSRRGTVENLDPRGNQSARQGKRGPGDGEITLEELMRLADRALGEPSRVNEVPAEAAFKMGESWASKEEGHKGVQRSKTFTEGSKRNEAEANEGRNEQFQSQSHLEQHRPFVVEAIRDQNKNQQQGPRYYEHNSNQEQTYENLSNGSALPYGAGGGGHRASPILQQRNQHKEPSPTAAAAAAVAAVAINDQKRKNLPADSLRMVIAESRMANKQRMSVLPESEFSNALQFAAAAEDSSRPFDIYPDSNSGNNSPKPVALVQPRKVPGIKVLPEPAFEGFQLQKVSHVSGKGAQDDLLKKEQYQAGNRNITRSVYDLSSSAIVTKPTTPQPPRKNNANTPDLDPARKTTNPDNDPSRKMANSNPEQDLSRKMSNPEVLDPAKKASIPEVSGREGKANDKQRPDREKKDQEIEAFAMNINLNKPPTNTISPNGTNFENALGYFP